MPSGTHTRSESKWKSYMANGGFGCGSGMTERALTRSFLVEMGAPKHYGLHGMRERAQLVGGKLAVWSKLDSGTEVELSIPASTAYATSYRRRSWLSEKFSAEGANGKETDVKETKIKS